MSENNQTHGCTKKKIYGVWKNMVRRCVNPKDAMYHLYGGRGIKVCERWRKFEFFLADMGHPPKGKTLDRIDNNGGYCQENCRWATPSEQAHNRRTTYIIEGKTIAEIANSVGIHRGTIYNRIRRGWSVEDAISTGNMVAEGKRDTNRKVKIRNTAEAIAEHLSATHKPKKK